MQKFFSGWLLAFSMTIGPFSVVAGEQIPHTPYDLCEGVKWTNKAQEVKMPIIKEKPEVGVPYIDPVFGTKITRVSDSEKMGTDVIKPVYSTIQAWNADESRFFLWHREKGHYLYDGKSYQMIKPLQFHPSDLEEVLWDPILPNLLYIIENDKVGSKLIQYNVANDKKTVLVDFVKEGICETGSVVNDANMISLEGRKIGLRCYEKDASRMMVYSIDEKKFSRIVTNKELGVHGYTALFTSLSGNTYIANEKVFDSDVNFQYKLNVAGSEHSTMGQFKDGSDGFFAVAFDPAPQHCENGRGIGMLVTHRFKDHTCHEFFGKSTGFPYPPGSVHLSPLSFHNPGWVALSAVGYENTVTLGEDQPLFHQELIISNADAKNHRYCRVGHHRSWGKYGKIGYFAEPHVTLSRDGRRMLFASDWHDSGSVDTYVLELPVYRKK